MKTRGFTLLELLFVLVIVALLVSLAAPLLTGSLARARETTLRENLRVMRKAIDDYHADTGKYPPELGELAQRRYLRAVPFDPITERSDSWTVVRSEDPRATAGVIDVRSGSGDTAADGSYYRDW